MEIKDIKLSDIKPYKNNPRNNESAVQQVANSIKEFGFKVPVVLDSNGVIVCGHTRCKAAALLGLESVPCVVADDLTPEQVKAFRLADNKVSELATWDDDLLNFEIDGIADLDMTDFGFEALKDTFLDGDKPDDEQEEPQKENARSRTNTAYNLDLVDLGSVTGKYEMPIVYDDHVIPTELISFNYAKSTEANNALGVHFYIDDYQFERVWNAPEDYVEILGKFQCMITPDFSLYMDMPLAMKIWNVYRNRLIGNYYQSTGIKVIPSVSWAGPDTYEFCFDGIQPGSTVSISTVGVKRKEKTMDVWRNGVYAMLDRIKPRTIIEYGGDVGFEYPKNIKVIRFGNTNQERMAKSDS